MTATPRLRTDAFVVSPLQGPAGAGAVHEAVDVVRGWAGEGLVAVLLSGSHASGEAVWFVHDGHRFTLSDLDFYAVMRDSAECRAAAERARRGRDAAAVRLAEAGFTAPLEVGFLTPAGLAQMAARPGTLELVRHGAAVAGDAGVLARVPRWTPREVSAEEVALLLENRGHELLAAWPDLGAPGGRERLRARHATLKAAADLAGVLALRAGEWPDGAAARVEWARPRAAAALAGAVPAELADVPLGVGRLWDTALAWRRGELGVPSPDEMAGEWRRTVRAWCAFWWWCFAGRDRDPWVRAARVAARAPLPRRLRRGLLTTAAGPLGRRWRAALAGTPQHRIDASGAILLLEAAAGGGPPALSAGALRALHALHVTAAADWDAARRDVLAAWNTTVLGGQRPELAR